MASASSLALKKFFGDFFGKLTSKSNDNGFFDESLRTLSKHSIAFVLMIFSFLTFSLLLELFEMLYSSNDLYLFIFVRSTRYVTNDVLANVCS